jgi:hypothetical protein
MKSVSKRSTWIAGLQKAALVALLAAMAQFSFAESDYAAAWGPAVGTKVPLLSASDHSGQVQNLDTLMGSKGLLFVFNRSVDW